MKILLYIATFQLISFYLMGQEKINQESSEVFSFLIRDKRKVFLLPNLDTVSFKSILNGLSQRQYTKRVTINDSLDVDTLTFTNEEMSFIETTLTQIKNYRWKQHDIKHYGLSKFNLIDKRKTSRKSDYNKVVYQIMRPIFLRSNTLCFVYYEYSCGGMCGHGELSILVKKNGKWDYWDAIFITDS